MKFGGPAKAAEKPSGINDHFSGRASECGLQTVQHVAAEDAFVTQEVRLQSARIFLAIEVDPDTKVQGRCSPTRDATHPSWSALGRGEVKPLTVCPGERAGVRPGVGVDSA